MKVLYVMFLDLSQFVIYDYYTVNGHKKKMEFTLALVGKEYYHMGMDLLITELNKEITF